MRSNDLKATLKTAVFAASLLLLAVGVSLAQQQVNLTAGPAPLILPDGSTVPMWGYSCGAVVSGGSTATCAALNSAAGGGWSPVVITVPTGQSLTINLTNNLSFNGNNIPTSLVIVGQLGGGLGTTATYVNSPTHDPQGVTWPTANTGAQNTPPPQGQRVQSFSAEVQATPATTTQTPTALTWNTPRPGTYLIESGTHPSIQGSMGLYGILVVTAAPSSGAAGTAYPNVPYNAEVPLLLSEIDPFQNNAVQTAVNTAGFVESATHGPMVGSAIASFTVANGGSGYTSTPSVVITGGGGTGANATASVTGGVVTGITLTSVGAGYAFPPNVTITDPSGAGATAVAVLQLQNVQTRLCGGAPACYPPVVNYTPLYYLINGAAFDKTNPSNSLFQAAIGTATAPVTGSVLVRFVNAGLRMHVPSIVGSQTTPLTVPTGTTASAVPGFSLIAEDGNRLPGVTRVQSEVFMAAGKTYDVMIDVPAASLTALPVFDRELSLSGSAIERDAGMLAYIGVNGSSIPLAITTAATAAAVANPDTYNSLTACTTAPCPAITVSDPTKGVLANDIYVYRASVITQPTSGTVTLNANGTFTYIPNPGTTSDSFFYCGNGASLGAACAKVTLGLAPIEAAGGITCGNSTYTSNVATSLSIGSPGVLSGCKDAKGYPLTVVPSSVVPSSGLSVTVDKSGAFVATVTTPGTYTFSFNANNSQGTVSTATATATLKFPAGSGLSVTVLDGSDKTTQIGDYRWVIEEDLTFFVDPKCTTNPLPSGCPTVAGLGGPVIFGTNFHTSHTPVVATGCTGALSCEGGQTVLGSPAVCDVGNGVCRPDTTGSGFSAVTPDQVYLDPSKRYYISVLPGDAAQPFIAGYGGAPDCNTAGHCGHGMGGAPIGIDPNTGLFQSSVTVLTQPSPYPPAKLSIFVFEDDYPLNGEHDAGGGIDVLSPQEPGLGGFQITLQDFAGGTGDATGTPTYDMFNQPLTNSLAGTIDPATGMDACPVSASSLTGVNPANSNTPGAASPAGITGMIITCPKYESDGKTLSPLAGQAVVNNLYPGRYGVVAMPGADRIARGEEWLQTNTLDGQKAHDSFLRIGEPGYFQEFGPGGYHVTIGFANPAIINGRKSGLCTLATPCNNEVKGHVTTARMSRTPDERLYGSGDRSSFAFTQCYASLGDPDGADFAFVKCDASGNFDFKSIPGGNWKLTLFDQWNDQIVDGISTPVGLAGQSQSVLDMGEVAAHQWQANFFSRTFIDLNGDGVSQPTEPGLALVKTNVRYRDGSISNRNNTDLNGYAAFNEEFPLFNWYVIETDVTRYKNTGTHVVYDAGGPTDGTTGGGNSTIAGHYANTVEQYPLPASLHVPGAVYCATADCSTESLMTSPVGSNSPVTNTTGRIDPPWVLTEGWQGFSGQNNFLEFGKKPYVVGENGGIRGHVVYSSTRPFDDPQFGTQNVWEPLVPGVTINLYQEGTAPDGTTSLTLVDTTQTSSFDKWAQGFRSDGMPNMNCPGQSPTDPFYLGGMQNQPNYLDWYSSQHGGPAMTTLPYTSQYKCYDGMHNWNQLQPAPYDGMYQFPSVAGMDPVTGKPAGTNCTVCVANPDTSDTFRSGLPMLPKGKYVVEVVVPPGYALVKEEDKNILIGDNFIAPVTQEFGGLGNVFILPDQASIASSYNSNSAQNPTNSLGRNQTLVSHEGDTPTVDTFWPCVGASRTVPDYISLFPQSKQVAPFAGATRNLCDRKEVTLDDQTSSQAEFFIFTPTHVASKFTGVITDDFSAEFDPFSPQFGEKFAPAYLPVSIKDWAGNEVTRVYSDQWGSYNGMSYSTWEVNPPNPTGYAPTMMVTCMNDRGAGTAPDPLYQPGYSQFCYELPFMPGGTGYFDTPVVPTSAFSDGYNHPDCAYPDTTPAIASVTSSDIAGPWAAGVGSTLTITALGDQSVNNNGYSGPSTSTAPFNQQKVNRHYGFGGQCTSISGACTAVSSVTIGGVPATVTAWSDTSITVTVPSGVPSCAVQQQQPLYAPAGTTTAQCGQLVITAGNGKQSVDAVTVTIGGKAPVVLGSGQTIQSAIDAAQPGDLIIVPPGNYKEMVIMWKPVRLQGVGAASSVIDATPHPAGKLDPWRRQIVCTFGLALNGTPINTTTGSNPYDPTGAFTCTPAMQFSVDRLPLEATVGWTATLNGNLAEQLIEPSLMGAYEGAGITVLGKGVKFNTTDPTVIWASDVFPAGTQLLTGNDCIDTSGTINPYPSNFFCNPSSIDGLSVTNSSQGGGGILVHGWGHNIEIANNRVHSNQGTLSGGITIGQGEHPDVSLAGVAPATIPGSCESDPLGTLEPGQVPNQLLAYCYDMHVNIHNNAVTENSSLGDELFSSTPAGAGGVTLCNGSDYYKFNYNWVCGNMSTGDGAGVAHLGFTKNGDIEHNSILFNESTNPTITTNGGGLLVMGAPDVDPPCAANNDNDCLSPPNTITPSAGTGPGLVINANLIMGNAADSGSGGGLRLQHINGTDVLNFPNGATSCPTVINNAAQSSSNTCLWNSVTVTNNIITNNVAGWDGGGVSLQDALAVNIVNNTIVSNDSTASAGPIFGSLFAPLASTPGVNCTTSTGDQSCPQVAGLVSVTNSPVLVANVTLGGTQLTCPPGHGTTGPNGSCNLYSVPVLANNVIWQNRSFVVGVGSYGSGNQNQQKTVTLLNSAFSGPATVTAVSQAVTGDCPTASYWDIGVRGDLGPTDHSGGTLSPMYSVLTDATDYPGAHNLGANPALASQYCNGSRVPPELGTMGYLANPGTNEVNALPTPIFSLTTAATVDEGNNWINLRWGPLALAHPVSGATLGNYAPTAGSPTIDVIGTVSPTYALAPSTDFFGNPRPDDQGSQIDIGAIEFSGGGTPKPAAFVSPKSLAFPNVQYGQSSSALPVTVSNAGNGGTVTVTGVSITGANASAFVATSACAAALAPTQSCTVSVVFSPTAAASEAASLTITTDDPTNPTFTVALSGTGTPAPLTITASSGSMIYGGTPPAVTALYSGFVYSDNPSSLTTQPTCSTTATSTSPVGSYPTTCAGAVDPNYAISYASGSVIVNAATTTTTITGHTPNPSKLNSPVTVNVSVAPQFTGTPTGSVTVLANSGESCTATLSGGAGNCQLTLTSSSCLVGRTLTATYSPGNGNFSGSTSAGVSQTVTFPVPTLTGVNPNTGIRGDVYSETLTGTGLACTSAITVSGVTPSAINVVNNTTVNATFAVAPGASIGVHNVRVTTPGGQSSAPGQAFTVNNPPAPTLTSITPITGVRGTAFTVTLTGTNFTTNGTSFSVSPTGVSVSNTSVTSSTSATATFTITTNATLSTRTVTVTNPNTSYTLNNAFTVTGPTLTSIAPNSGNRGSSVPVIFTGTNLGTATGLTGLPTGVTIANGTFTPGSTTVTATLNISGTATLGAANIAVVTSIGTTTTLPFTVTQLVPTYTVTPGALAFGNQLVGTTGTAQSVTITNTSTNGAALLVNAPTKGGSNANQWGTPVNNCPASLAAGSNCTISVACAPTSTGGKSANLNVNVGAPATPTQTVVPLTGTGVQAVVSFSGPVPAMNGGGSSTKNGVITVTNTGTAPLTLSATVPPSIAKVSGSGTGTPSIQPGGTCTLGKVVAAGGGACTINVRWVPTTTTTANLAVSVTDTGAASGTQTSATFPAN